MVDIDKQAVGTVLKYHKCIFLLSAKLHEFEYEYQRRVTRGIEMYAQTSPYDQPQYPLLYQYLGVCEYVRDST